MGTHKHGCGRGRGCGPGHGRGHQCEWQLVCASHTILSGAEMIVSITKLIYFKAKRNY